ncbi:hypothetical protein HW115_03025 [Verrucomicrobiaceae bacterium N1E253]|uniref:DUF177 domain-containing protein n=1 Tax=Oceaniferula marina TaxID=2748318 RepID=A0A851GA07_9BACT|nr:hypothetical protein [Oceaniferula marina]NWK54568.1 hypothetical protein [Oceaniferula marina]
MKKHLFIDLATLPEEGKTFSGELDPSIFTFDHEDTKATGPLFYDLYVQQFDKEVLARGAASVPISFTCVRTLEPFVKTMESSDLCLSLEAGSGQIDLAELLREEMILLFPDYPRCDEADEPKECILDSRYLAVDKPPEDDVKTPPASEEPDPWAALDALQNEKEENDGSL